MFEASSSRVLGEALQVLAFAPHAVHLVLHREQRVQRERVEARDVLRETLLVEYARAVLGVDARRAAYGELGARLLSFLLLAVPLVNLCDCDC